MTDYDITIGPTEFFICKHPEPHDGPCERSAFLDVDTCGARLADSRQDLCCERSSHHYAKPHRATGLWMASDGRHVTAAVTWAASSAEWDDEEDS